MTWHEGMTWCDGCGVEITWGPVMIDARAYCCQDCANGYTCSCGERMEMDDDMRNAGAETAPAHPVYLA